MSLIEIFKQCHTDITIDIHPEIIACIFSDDKFVSLLDELNIKLQYNISKLHVNEYQTNIDLNTRIHIGEQKHLKVHGHQIFDFRFFS